MKTDINQFRMFCDRWLVKAQGYNMDCLPDYFDKFTTLYSLFNAAYNQAGFLIRQSGTGKLFSKIAQKHPNLKPYVPLPDRISATNYIVQYYDEGKLQQEISADSNCRCAVKTLVDLIETGRFYFHENYETGRPDVTKDLKFAQSAKKYDPKAILSLI